MNANNDNGSQLFYSDLKTQVPDGGYGIPELRDFDVPLLGWGPKGPFEDPDLLPIILVAGNLTNQTVELKVEYEAEARARVRLWGTRNKQNPATGGGSWVDVDPPMRWTKKDFDAKGRKEVYVEGIKEGAGLREVTLTLTIENGAQVVDSDSCKLTVTPVLETFVIDVTQFKTRWGTWKDAYPDLQYLKLIGLALASNGGVQRDLTFTTYSSAIWTAVRGDLRFIVNNRNINNFNYKGRRAGAISGDKAWRWDFAPPNQGAWLVDSHINPPPRQFLSTRVLNVSKQYSFSKAP